MTDENTTQPAGIRLEDILYTLFRRKWIILAFCAVGLSVAGGLFIVKKPVYQSEAKLLLRYVQENRSATTVDKDSQIRSPDSGGDSLINSELEILGSLDLAMQVAGIIGPEKIQETAGKETNMVKAALIIQKGLQVDVPRRSSIIRLVFSHGDPDVAQSVLRQLTASYLKKHVELHLGLGDLEKFLQQQTDQLKGRLSQTDEALQQIKQKAGIISPEEARKSYMELMSKIRQELFQVEADIEQRKVTLAETEKLAPAKSEDATALEAPLEKVEEYQSICAELSRAQSTKRDMLAKYTPESPALQQFLARIARAEQDKKKLEQEFPKLVSLGIAAVSAATGTNQVDFTGESTRVKALEARAKVLTTQMQIIRTDMAGLEQAETEIAELMRQRMVEEAQFLSYSKSLEQARIQENMGAGKIINIGEVQAPSFPTRSRKETKKLMLQVAGAAIALGLGLAFGMDLVLDPSIKRPQEIETRLKLPLFFWLPVAKKRKGVPAAKPQDAGTEVKVWNGLGTLRPYFEAMRDRLIQYFEAGNLTHKPKLVAVTSCGDGSGASSVAKGLAMSLAEAGDGNILLVDMTHDHGSAQAFSKSEGLGLPEALELGTRDSAQVQDKLYLAKSDELSGGLQNAIPRRFTHLVPKMKASDYDFIIFDLPPVNATSITARLAGFMDLVLEVAEAEKTNRDTVKRIAAILGRSQPNVAVVLNKCQKRLPAWLHQEF